MPVVLPVTVMILSSMPGIVSEICTFDADWERMYWMVVP